MHKMDEISASQRLRRGPIGGSGLAGTAGRAKMGTLKAEHTGNACVRFFETHACVIPYIIRAHARIYRLAKSLCLAPHRCGEENRVKIMERTYRCKNGVVEKTRYHVGDNARPRGRKTGVTTPRQQEQNFNTAVRRLARLLNCNCTADKGLLVTLRFADEGIDKLRETAGDDPDKLRDAAEHQAMLWLRRLRRKDKGVIPFYTLSASDMDGDTGELVRLHVHICMETDGSLSWDALRDAWTLGSVNIRSLRGQDDYSPIAYYMLKQVRRVPDRKKYKVSRGAALPTTEEREVVLCTKMRAPKGARVLEERYVEGEAGAYLRYVPRKRGKKLGGHKLTARELLENGENREKES